MRRFLAALAIVPAVVLPAGCGRAVVPPGIVMVSDAPPVGQDNKQGNVSVGQGEAMVGRWQAWTLSGLTQSGYPELPHRDRCAQDPASEVWFLDGVGPGLPTDSWACGIPAGHAAMVVPMSGMVMVGNADCSVIFSAATAEVVLDGTALATYRTGPVSVVTVPDPLGAPTQLGYCVVWAMTPPLSRGVHTVVASFHGPVELSGTVTVTLHVT